MTPKERVEAFKDEAAGRCFHSAGIGGADDYHKWFDDKLVEMVRAAEIEALGWAKELYEDELNRDCQEDERKGYFLSRLNAEIERRKTL